jgi:hypothetical protein
MRREAVEVELIDRESQCLVGVPVPAPCWIPADQHLIEPEQYHSPAGRRLRPEDYVDAFVPAEVEELDLESTGQARFIAVTVRTSVDFDRVGGARAAGRGNGDCCADRHSQSAQGADDGDPYGPGH